MTIEDILDDVNEFEDDPHCPCCLGLGGFLGQLGMLLWFRCIQCGAQFSQEDNQ